ncbi:hypothetical protein PAAG_04467 [Paracoccidioides lutzii Pb01]|uniref:DUF202 domain-containing protein n=1 Tax=Paracoccidioides lutzii (strain ATCC MYA-826 / Pb01) TaxID=502779 RepID=C1H123_PARBA|nr:hypothetical protein PAAG_04467 [Paracoccidioides lutzii Pb01]EEH33417.1 hypothetical protein PAAG_04467 [Paracoccidioides lutzii Pb01]
MTSTVPKHHRNDTANQRSLKASNSASSTSSSSPHSSSLGRQQAHFATDAVTSSGSGPAPTPAPAPAPAPAPTEDTPIATANRGRTERNYRATENGTVDDYVGDASQQPTQTQHTQNPQRKQPTQARDHTDDTRGSNDGGAGARARGAIAHTYKRVVQKYSSLELDNKGSVARDHLALERTFLAWLRTSLAFASIGIAVTQLFRLNGTITNANAHLFPPVSSQQQQIQASTLTNPLLSQQYVPLPPAPQPLPIELLTEQVTPKPANQPQPQPQPQSQSQSQPPSQNPTILTSNELLTQIKNGRRLRSLGKPLGATFLCIAIIVLLIGFHRYFEGQYWVIRGKFPASRGSIALVAFIAGSLMVSSLVVILMISQETVEK